MANKFTITVDIADGAERILTYSDRLSADRAFKNLREHAATDKYVSAVWYHAHDIEHTTRLGFYSA